MASSSKCIFCGRPSIIGSPTGNLKPGVAERHGRIFSKWKEHCARTMCEILFGNKKHLYRYYFKQKDSFCSTCQQIVRDIQLTWNQIQLLQYRLEELTTTIRKNLHANYLSIDKNIINTGTKYKNEAESDEIKNTNSNDSKIIDNVDNYSYNNAILLIYKAASKVCDMATSELLFADEDDEPEPEGIPMTPNTNEPDEELPVDKSIIDKKVKIKMEVESMEESCFSYYDDDDHLSEGEVNSDTEKTIATLQKSLMQGRPMRKSASAALTKFEKFYDSDHSFNEGYDDIDFGQDSESNDFPDPKASPSENKKVSKTKKKKRIRPSPPPMDEKIRIAREKKRAYVKKHRELYGRKDYIVKRIPCTVENCKVKFRNDEAKDIHFQEAHSGVERPFGCTKCNKTFAKYIAYKKHMELVHSGAKRYDHYCKYCDKGYERQEELENHYATSHLGPNPFCCAFCEKVYSNNVDLRIHMRNIHPDSGTFICDVCGKTCGTQASLNAHVKYHADPDSLFKCTLCSHVTISASALKSHMERHGTEPKYTCEVCGKTFNSSPAIKRHSLIHVPKIPKFECKICAKPFTCSNHCKRHEMTHTGMKNHICTTCGRAFALKYNLSEHEKIHLREKGFDIPMRKQRTYIKKPSLDIKILPDMPTYYAPPNMGQPRMDEKPSPVVENWPLVGVIQKLQDHHGIPNDPLI